MKINTAPYPVSLEVFTDTAAFRKRYKNLKGIEVDLTGTNGLIAYSGSTCLIGVFTNDVITFVHEINHFCLWTFDYIGLPVNTAHSEAYCYYHDHILVQSLRLLRP